MVKQVKVMGRSDEEEGKDEDLWVHMRTMSEWGRRLSVWWGLFVAVKGWG